MGMLERVCIDRMSFQTSTSLNYKRGAGIWQPLQRKLINTASLSFDFKNSMVQFHMPWTICVGTIMLRFVSWAQQDACSQTFQTLHSLCKFSPTWEKKSQSFPILCAIIQTKWRPVCGTLLPEIIYISILQSEGGNLMKILKRKNSTLHRGDTIAYTYIKTMSDWLIDCE